MQNKHKPRFLIKLFISTVKSLLIIILLIGDWSLQIAHLVENWSAIRRLSGSDGLVTGHWVVADSFPAVGKRLLIAHHSAPNWLSNTAQLSPNHHHLMCTWRSLEVTFTHNTKLIQQEQKHCLIMTYNQTFYKYSLLAGEKCNWPTSYKLYCNINNWF